MAEQIWVGREVHRNHGPWGLDPPCSFVNILGVDFRDVQENFQKRSNF